MSLPDPAKLRRRSLLLLPLALATLPLALAACGFSPAYAPGGPAARMLGTVRAADPDTKNAFDFVERIEERLGRPEDVRFDLNYRIETKRIGVGITADNRTTRYNLQGVATYTLVEQASGQTIASSPARRAMTMLSRVSGVR